MFLYLLHHLKLNKKKFISFIFLIFIVMFLTLILLNLSSISKYQSFLRDVKRNDDLEKIKQGIENYIKANNNCPKTSNPVPNTYLPNLIIEDGLLKGGVNISSLENIDKYINKHIVDPKGKPYLIGVKDDYIYVYSNNFEQESFQSEGNIRSLYRIVSISCKSF